MSTQHVQYVLSFLVFVVNSNQFQILQSYTLLLKLPILVVAFPLAIYTVTKHRYSNSATKKAINFGK